jgi:hypothetical protein
MNRFEAGKVYWTRSACDHECIFSWKVIRRTEKSVWLREEGKHFRNVGIRRRQIKDFRDGVETCFPDGTYSMCPVISADRYWV